MPVAAGCGDYMQIMNYTQRASHSGVTASGYFLVKNSQNSLNNQLKVFTSYI